MPAEDLLLSGTEVEFRGLRWEVVAAAPAGKETLLRLRGLGGAFGGSEVDVLSPFDILEHGLHWTEAHIAPLGGRLFGQAETPLLSACDWSEIGCARLLDNLLWTPEKAGRGKRTGGEAVGRRRISYADLDVEDLGRVYEALLELEPGLAVESMVRLRRAKLEVVLPAAAVSMRWESGSDHNTSLPALYRIRSGPKRSRAGGRRSCNTSRYSMPFMRGGNAVGMSSATLGQGKRSSS